MKIYTFNDKVLTRNSKWLKEHGEPTTPPEDHWAAFDSCGRDTVTGAAELAQIPSDWGGTAS